MIRRTDIGARAFGHKERYTRTLGTTEVDILTINNSTVYERATEKLGRVFVGLSGPKGTRSLLGKRYVIIVKDYFTRYSWVSSSSESRMLQMFLESSWLIYVQMECLQRWLG